MYRLIEQIIQGVPIYNSHTFSLIINISHYHGTFVKICFLILNLPDIPVINSSLVVVYNLLM